jgi:hypothetical protein
MKSRGMIFTGESVQALLAGTKTQARMLLTPQPAPCVDHPYTHEPKWIVYATGWHCDICGNGVQLTARDVRGYRWPKCKPGDTIWVKEVWGGDSLCGYAYRADHPDLPRFPGDGEQSESAWKSPMFMPRAASRLTLLITDVRVQRLQEISEADAIAEGCPAPNSDGYTYLGNEDNDRCVLPSTWFRHAWNAIQMKRLKAKRVLWEANPWICAISFAKETSNA